jgi:hypothetical protein
MAHTKGSIRFYLKYLSRADHLDVQQALLVSAELGWSLIKFMTFLQTVKIYINGTE